MRSLLATIIIFPLAARADDDALARQARLELILPRALAANPDLAEERARVRAAAARATLATRLPEPQLKYEHWHVPLGRPYALGEANAVMVGLAQTLPPPGARAAQGRMAAGAAGAAAAAESTRRRELAAQVRRAYADYFRADREGALHREHVELTTRLVELARGNYRGGRGSQQDVLRLDLELARLHRDVAHIEQERISARALLNALMARPPDAALGPPADLPAPAAALAPAPRAELDSARAALARSEAALDLARATGRWPSLTLGADYMYMPEMPARHGWGAMVMMNLPWLGGGRRDEIRAAEATVAAERAALASVRHVLAYEARDAEARLAAATTTLAIIDRDLLPQARRNFETAQAGYASGQADAIALVDALRSYLETRVDRVRGLVHVDNAATEHARTRGAEAAR